MSKLLYIDGSFGVSGDMLCGALIDLGANREKIMDVLGKLSVQGFKVEIGQVKKAGLAACDFNVILDHEHENHDHDMEYLHGHEHHHEHDENCTCGCHDHDHEHHHHHHADDVFTSWGKETPHKFEKSKIEEILKGFVDSDNILRSKGMVESVDGSWIYFDMVPGEYEIREGEPDYTGRIVVIGTEIHEDELLELFGLN
mgnify:CR=1 FL=1